MQTVDCLILMLGRYYTDPSGTFWQCNAKAIGSGSEGADSSLQEQYNKVDALILLPDVSIFFVIVCVESGLNGACDNAGLDPSRSWNNSSFYLEASDGGEGTIAIMLKVHPFQCRLFSHSHTDYENFSMIVWSGYREQCWYCEGWSELSSLLSCWGWECYRSPVSCQPYDSRLTCMFSLITFIRQIFCPPWNLLFLLSSGGGGIQRNG